MAFSVTSFEPTPNPNAVKCLLDRPISTGPRSFLNAAAAESDPIARALFAVEGVTSVLMNRGWITVNKRAETAWSAVKPQIKRVLREAE